MKAKPIMETAQSAMQMTAVRDFACSSPAASSARPPATAPSA
jgi:hypothetical protein